jgi:phosphotriesterase-related protein
MELAKFTAAGGTTIVDLTGLGYASDAAFVRDVAAHAGIQVVLGTGIRGRGWLPEEMAEADASRLARHFVAAVAEGDASAVRCGVIGPVGIGRWAHPFDRVALQAAAGAQRETGVGLVVSLDLGADMGRFTWALDVLEEAGAEMGRLAVGRILARPDHLPVIRAIAGRGAFVLLDCFGQDSDLLMADLMDTPAEVQTASLRALLDLGFGPRMLLSHGLDRVALFTVNGGGGYAHLLRSVLPRAADYRVTDQERHALTVENPRRFLAGS